MVVSILTSRKDDFIALLALKDANLGVLCLCCLELTYGAVVSAVTSAID